MIREETLVRLEEFDKIRQDEVTSDKISKDEIRLIERIDRIDRTDGTNRIDR